MTTDQTPPPIVSISDYLYTLRDTAGMAIEPLRAAIREAQAVVDRLDAIADGAERAAELVGASDLEPNTHANIPPQSGLVRAISTDPDDGFDEGGDCTNCGHPEFSHRPAAMRADDAFACRVGGCDCTRYREASE